MRVIGLVGLAGAGKTTVARRLIEHHGFAQGKYARALKLMLRTLLIYRGVDGETIGRMIDGDLKEVPSPHLDGKTPRWAMQSLGTEWGRTCIGPNYWVETEAEALGMHPGLPGKARPNAIVFDDVRFPNEVDLILKSGGEIWGVRRTAEAVEASPNAHESERLAYPPSLLFINDGTVEQLHEAIEFALRRPIGGA